MDFVIIAMSVKRVLKNFMKSFPNQKKILLISLLAQADLLLILAMMDTHGKFYFLCHYSK